MCYKCLKNDLLISKRELLEKDDILNLGDKCAYEKDGKFYRVKIIKKITRQNRKSMIIKSLDVGWTARAEIDELYKLPQNLAAKPDSVIDIHLCRLEPRDSDTKWNQKINNIVNKWLTDVKSNEEKGFYLQGKIVLSIAGHIWLDPFECRQHLETVDANCIKYSFRKKYLDNGLAVDNKDHLENLYKLCYSAGMNIPDYKQQISKTSTALCRPLNENIKPYWAFLADESEVVIIELFNTNGRIFIRKLDFDTLLDKLNDDIISCKVNGALKRIKTIVHKDLFVIAPFYEDNMYYRGIVMDVDESQTTCTVFFVDYGNTCANINIKKCYAMPDEILSRLPFQAIECNIFGIHPYNKTEWSEEAMNYFCDTYIGVGKYHVVQVVKKVHNDEIGAWRYIVNLFDMEKEVYINDDLVQNQYAHWYKEDKPQNETNWNEINAIFYKNNVIQKELQVLNEQVDEVIIHESADEAEVDEDDFSDTEIDNFIKYCKDDVSATILDATIFTQGHKELLCKLVDGICAETDLPAIKNNIQEISSILETPPAKLSENQIITLEPQSGLIRTTYEPTIHWKQDEKWIVIKINLPGIEKYELTVTTNYFDFNTESQNKIYFVSKNLFGYVNPDITYHEAKGLCVEIKLRKLSPYPWARLTREKTELIQGVHAHKTIYDHDALTAEENKEIIELHKNLPWYTKTSFPVNMDDDSSGNEEVEEVIVGQTIVGDTDSSEAVHINL